MPDAYTSPEVYVEALISKAEIVKTPCGDGDMVWQVWGQETDKAPLLLLHGGFGAFGLKVLFVVGHDGSNRFGDFSQ